jgi:hypothetical protein
MEDGLNGEMVKGNQLGSSFNNPGKGNKNTLEQGQ